MAKLNQTAATVSPVHVSPALLANVRAAASSCVISYDELRRAIAKAKGNQDEVRAAVIEGAMVGALYKGELSEDTLAKVRKILSNVGATASTKPKEGQGRRTAAQETAYASARQVWSRLLKKAKVASADKRGGANNPGKGNGREDHATVAPIVAAPIATVPRVKATIELRDQFQLAAAQHLASLKKNADAKGGNLAAMHALAKAYFDGLTALQFDHVEPAH